MTQGDPEATPFYCVTWHKYVREAESALKAVGGVARFLSDDGYLVGPPREVFQIFTTFREDLRVNCGLNMNLSKCEVFIQTDESVSIQHGKYISITRRPWGPWNVTPSQTYNVTQCAVVGLRA